MRDVRVIQRRQRPRFTFESRQALWIGREGLGQDLDGDVAPEVGIARAIHLAHATRAEQADDLVMGQAGTGGEALGVGGRHWDVGILREARPTARRPPPRPEASHLVGAEARAGDECHVRLRAP